MLVVGCGGGQRPSADAVTRSTLDIIQILCPPEMTVGDCTNRVKAWLPADAGKDGGA